MSSRIVLIASDHAGYNLKEHLITILPKLNAQPVDLGCAKGEQVDYTLYAATLAQKIQCGEAPLGILICGTGIGMSIAANKFRGIRAALCHDTFSARAAREHNDSNILCLGERVIGSGLAADIAAAWLNSSFQGGRHLVRVNHITAFEERWQPASKSGDIND